MKYGLNQWSRISSLLVRKSAKQCKARWYEWLDPSIKKTEWTKEEEEKLLHLAKIFPSQWRTISPIIGRTPAQCAEHYERLLDLAQGKTEMDENDPRKLKPGEIDPAPEIKPAKPDPIDMDEDEKEMIAEARVRLANTKGKKAKRKVRQKMIEEARRLALLQKQRELKAAGVDYIIKTKIKGIDYNKEIPFERLAPDFIYQTGADETPKPNLQLGNISLQTLEGTRRDEEEALKRKNDAKKMKKFKDQNLPAAYDKIQAINEPAKKPKTKLLLPAPQITDKDLESIAKLNSIQGVQDTTNPATRALMGNYTQRGPTPTPMRTPRYEDSVMREAQNALAMMTSQTPLLGGESAPLAGHQDHLTGMTPKHKVPATPNILLQNLKANPANLGINHPRHASTVSRYGETPLRDEIVKDEDLDQAWEGGTQSNVEGGLSVAKLEKLKKLQRLEALKGGLSALPKPRDDYQFDIPDVILEETPKEKSNVIDAEDLDAQARQQKAKEKRDLFLQRNKAIQRNLPRPFVVNLGIKDEVMNVSESRKQAEDILYDELNKLLIHDAMNFPMKGSKAPQMAVEIDYIPVNDIARAEYLLQAEIALVKKELNAPTEGISNDYLQQWDQTLNSITYSTIDKKFLLANGKEDLSLKFIRKLYEAKRDQIVMPSFDQASF